MNNQKGVSALILLALVGILFFVFIATSTSFKDKLFSSIYPMNQPAATAINRQANVRFRLYTRVTDKTWPQLQPFAREGDLYWGHVNGIPANMAAYTFPDYATLSSKASDDVLSKYAAVNLDGEYKDFGVANTEAQQIRALVNAYNSRNMTNRSAPLKFVAFYHLNIIDAYPQIVSYPDVVLFGKAVGNASNIAQNSQQYVSLIKQARNTPGVLLGDSKIDFTTPELIANFHSVFDPAPTGLGLNIVGFYYPLDRDDSLIGTLQVLRRQ